MQIKQLLGSRPFTLGPTLGVGAFGVSYDMPSREHVAKVVGDVDVAKLRYLIANEVLPTQPGYRYAWPRSLGCDPTTGKPNSYAMAKAIDGIDTEALFSPVGVPDWFRIRVVLNHARSLIDLEDHGYHRGDLPNSLFHRDGSITEIDLDSLQVTHADAKFNSGVAKAFTAAPEVLAHYRAGGGTDNETTREHDAWAFATLAWLILMRGEHPYDAVPAGAGAARNLEERVLAGQWPHDPSCLDAEPRRGARPFTDLDPTLQSLFRQTFVDGHPNHDSRNRPTLHTWEKALEPINARTP